MTDRVINFEGIHNFRDYGGYALKDGGKLKRGLLWRSGQHMGASEADLQRVATLNLRTIIDLRGATERRNMPCKRHDAFAGEVLFFDGETGAANGQAQHIAAANIIDTAQEAHHRMITSYEGMAWRPALVAVIQQYMRALAKSDGANLIHCLAGKDRTGLSVATFHALMGVHSDDIMADYLLTNTAGDAEARVAEGGRAIRALRSVEVSDGVVRTLMMVDAQYLHTAMEAVKDRHGSLRAYAREVLAVDDAMMVAMRANWVE
jgi:protein-tyrosine phosphatase